LRQVRALAPSNDRAMRLLGQLEASSGQVDEGVRTLRTVVERFPNWPNYRALGTVLFNAGRYVEAEQQYRECTALQPDNPFALQLLGASLQKQKKDGEAVRAYERALAIQPSAAAYTNLGTYQYGLGDLKAAERAYRKAVELRPQDPLMQRNLSDALRAQGRAVDARDGYARAANLAEAELRVNPQDQTALSTAAYSWARAGNCELSDGHSARIESATSPQVDGLIDVANARLICGSITRALANLEAIRTEGVDLSNVLEQDVAASAPREVRQIVARQLDPK
jgi:Flp pilus assembly protein TadD